MSSTNHTALLALALLSAACRYDMQDQPKYKPLARSDFFADGRSARPVVPGTIPRGALRVNQPLFAGMQNGKFIEMPIPVTRELLERGQGRYNIYCSPCHSRVGDGSGIIAQRGFHWPASFHNDRLRRAPDGYIFDVITYGYGAMSSYAIQVQPRDRWAIVAYIRALQLSRDATVADLTPEGRAKLGISGEQK
jgi:mono/diheme cytochrome c family protein